MSQAETATSTHHLARAITLAAVALPVFAAANSPALALGFTVPKRSDSRLLAACAVFITANNLRFACSRGEDVAGAPCDYDHVEETEIEAAWHAALQRVIQCTPWTPRGLAEKATALMLALRVVAAPLLRDAELLREIAEERSVGHDAVTA